ncbi:hypothetical protein [Micromonospora sp. KC721]|uniref:hypothetical protein n=1 Tax=Micromonospora sp. KC721 TaxID=2530380 RepID=UPI001404284D
MLAYGGGWLDRAGTLRADREWTRAQLDDRVAVRLTGAAATADVRALAGRHPRRGVGAGVRARAAALAPAAADPIGQHLLIDWRVDEG